MEKAAFDVVIIGGGLAGLTASINLSQRGFSVALIEKNTYPFHKVCGEYVSNEVMAYLKALGFNPLDFGAKEISKLNISGTSGVLLEGDLGMGAFGISRYKMDHGLYGIAKKNGVTTFLEEEVLESNFENDFFTTTLKTGVSLTSKVVLGAYGKRAKLDKKMERGFMSKRSPYVGVKYHIKIDSPQNLISLHNFENGYCGMSAIEDDLYCLCYLTERVNFDKHKSVEGVEKNVLRVNPYLDEIFAKAEFIYEKPLVINEISFAPKTQVENHILMIGDTAGLITPLCGNGMAIAIHGGKLASESVSDFLNGSLTRQGMESKYTDLWKKTFSRRLWAGRNIQKLFGGNFLTNTVLKTLNTQPWLLSKIVKATHGEEV